MTDTFTSPDGRVRASGFTPLPYWPETVRLRAYLSGTYDTLRWHFGQPMDETGDPDKIHIQWSLATPVGPVVIYDYGDCHMCRITSPRPGEEYVGGCRRNPAHRLLHRYLWEWHVQAEDGDALAWLEHLAGLYVTPKERVW